jgi:hypothetical protein
VEIKDDWTSPNHFLDEPALSITSTGPGRSGSIDGTWFARIPMSPVAPERLTCTTSVEVNIACNASELWTAHQASGVSAYIRTSYGRTRESLILSEASAYPRRPKTEERGARRATEEARRRADIYCARVRLQAWPTEPPEVVNK